MFKAIRVILSLAPGGFLSGIASARTALNGFVSAVKSGISSAIGFFANLNQVVELAGRIMHGLQSAISWVNRTFLEGAIAGERFEATLTGITGNAEQAAEMNDYLRQRAIDLGLSYEDLTMSGQQLAAALKGANGEVDLDTWKEYSDLMTQFQALRPDVPIGLWGRAISAFMAGDSSSLTRLLDINIKQLGNLTEETKAFMQGATEATDQQLGQVTALAGQVPGTAGDALDALKDIANGIGATEELVQLQAETTGGTLDRIKARWKEFTMDVGDTFLPHLEKALDGFISFLDDHQEEIDAFAEALGKFAGENFEKFATWLLEQDWDKIGNDIAKLATEGFGTLKEFVEGEDFQNAAQAIKELFASLGDSDTGFMDAIQNIDWPAVAEAMNAIANAVKAVAEGGQAFGDWIGQSGGSGVGAAGIGQQAGAATRESIFAWLNEMGPKVFPNMDRNQEAVQQTPSQGPGGGIDLKIALDFDEASEKIIAFFTRTARNEAQEEIGAFTKEVTGAGH